MAGVVPGRAVQATTSERRGAPQAEPLPLEKVLPFDLSHASWAVSAVCLVFTIGVLCWHGGALNFSTSYASDDEVALYRTAVMMLVPALLLEISHSLTCEKPHPFIHIPSALILKLAVYVAMWKFNGCIVHVNQRSPTPHAVYTLRWMDWAVAVPLMSGSSLLSLGSDSCPLTIARIAPTMANCFAFVITGWAGQIVPHPVAAWGLNVLCSVAWLMYLAEQGVIVFQWRQTATNSNFKVGSIIAKNVLYALYGVVMLFDNVGVLASLTVQTFYTYTDVILKSLQASVLGVVNNWEVASTRALLSGRMQSAEEDMANLIAAASAPIVCMNSQGAVVGWNSQIAKLTQISEEDAKGKLLQDLALASCRHQLKAALEECRGGKQAKAVELSFIKSMEEQDEIGARVTMSFAKLGASSAGLVGIGQDMTELIATQEMQERRMRFTTLVGHELKKPLHGMTGLTKSLIKATQDKSTKKQLSMIFGCGQRLLDTVCNIIEQASLDKAKAKQIPARRPEQVNVLDLVDEVISLSRAATDKTGRLFLQEGVPILNNMNMEKMPLVNGDTHKIMQLLYNLVHNACKFTQQGHIEVSGRCYPGSIEIDVSDTGCGITADALLHIFELYQPAAQSAETRAMQGVGLGLPVAKAIAELHGGSIRVKSELGIGSTFTVSLPCGTEEGSRTWAPELATPAPPVQSRQRNAEEPEVALEAAACESPSTVQSQVPMAVGLPVSADDPVGLAELLKQLEWASSQPIAPGEKPVVLSVDDDDVNHIVLENQLSEQFKIEKAMDGYEALDYLRSGQRPPCMVLLDLMMPGMNGWEVVKEIRMDLKLGHVALPVVMLSARSPVEETATRSLAAGATDFMLKPFDVNVLREKMKAILNVKKEGFMLYQKLTRCPIGHSGGAPVEGDSASSAAALASAKEELFAARREVDRLQSEMSRVQEEADGRVQQVKQKQEKAARLIESQRAEEVQRELASQQELSSARRELQHLRSELARAKEAAVEESPERATGCQPAQSREELDAAKQEVQRLKEEIERARAEAEEKVKDERDSQQELESSRRELEASKEQVCRLQDELARAREQAEEGTEATKKRLEEEAAAEMAIKREHLKQAGRMEVQKELTAAKREVLRLQGELASAREERQSEAAGKPAAGEDEVAEARREVKRLQDEVAQLKAGQSDGRARSTQDQLSAKLEIKRQQSERLRVELHETKVELASLRAEASRVADIPSSSTFHRMCSKDSSTSALSISFGARETGWYRRELESAQGELLELVQKLSTSNTEAHMQRSRADGSEREVAFLKEELSKLQQLLASC